jgi:hypothetical protein
MPSEMYLANWNTYQTAWADIPATERQELLRKSVDQIASIPIPRACLTGMSS